MVDPESNLDALAKYIEVLAASARETTTASDRPRYRDHLAAAAEMFAAIQLESSSLELKRRIESEKRSYGVGYLSGVCGADATAAFVALAEQLGSA